jgi:hypothetical protein
MACFPFMVDISGKTCLIVGGDRIALHKTETLQCFLPGGVNNPVRAYRSTSQSGVHRPRERF